MHRFMPLAQNRKLVSIRRDEIDDRAIQGFILGFSDDLLLVQYVYDFTLDGLLVLRTGDITDIKCTATDEFQTGLLVAEQLYEQVLFEESFALHDWKAILTQFSQQYKFMIVEDERPATGIFLIGEIEKITNTNVWLRHFSGVGHWDEKPTKLACQNITSCQVGTSYIRMYERHLERTA